ncbi:MAG TPA: major capsid protein [Coriobacteriia bacterium]|nr:major capsid protein [Coriobacteriia bacterium]
MADLFRRAMAPAFDELVKQDVTRPRFLQGYFGKNPGEIVRSETERIEFDSLRVTRAIASDVARGSGDFHKNTVGVYTNKDILVPLYNEKAPVTASMLKKRIPGVEPFAAVSDMAARAYWCAHVAALQALKIFRAMELQAAQALTTGIILLSNGVSLDWGKVASHAITPAVKWDVGGSNPINDIEAACDINRADGFAGYAVDVIMGQTAFNVFINNAAVIAYMNGRYIEPGRMAPGTLRDGARAWGSLGIGPYMVTVYVYNDSYVTGGVDTPYLTTDTVIVMDPNAHLVKGFAAVEMLQEVAEMYRTFGMPAIPQAEVGDVVPYAYPEWPGTLWAGVQSAPVMAPAAIDTISTLVNVDT